MLKNRDVGPTLISLSVLFSGEISNHQSRPFKEMGFVVGDHPKTEISSLKFLFQYICLVQTRKRKCQSKTKLCTLFRT